MCGFSVTIVALGLYSFYVRELLMSPFLFSAVFLTMGLIAVTTNSSVKGTYGGQLTSTSNPGLLSLHCGAEA
jgi:hypothetical protein